jgi:hypothetical protein
MKYNLPAVKIILFLFIMDFGYKKTDLSIGAKSLLAVPPKFITLLVTVLHTGSAYFI